MSSGFESFIKKDLKTLNFNIIKKDYIESKNKDFFPYHGIQVFTGMQGCGKTISLVKTLLDLKKKYPAAIVVSNMMLNVPWDYIEVHTLDEVGDALTGVNNGKLGVIYVLDEIHTYFNSLDSKNIPMYIFAQISQQRKQRKLILGSSQLMLRVAKPFREQTDTIILCDCYFGKFNINTVLKGDSVEEIDGKIVGDVKKVGFFMQTEELRNSFDTFQVVQSGREQYEEYMQEKNRKALRNLEKRR